MTTGRGCEKLQLTTTGQGLRAGRLTATRGLFGARELAQGGR